MDSYKSELNKISVQKKSDYLELIKQYRKNIDMRKSFDITLHKSLKIFNEKKNNPNEKEIQNQDEKKEKMIIKNLEENILTPPKKIKKHIIKTSPKKRQGAKIIYKNSTNLIKKLKECPSENIEKEKLNQKENVNKNILNNDKDASTTSTTSPITTPIKGIKDSNSDNFSTIFFSGDNHKRSYYHYEKNKKKYNETFNIINDTINTTTFDKFNETEYQDNTLDNNYFNNTIQIPEYLPKKIVINKRLVDKTQTNGKYYNYYQNQNLNKNNSNKYDLSLNIEDLIMIEDKFSKLIKTVNDHNINIVNKTCYEWWNYYFNCSLKGNCDYLFSEPRNKNVIACYNSLLLISIMLIYDLSFQPKLFLKLIDFLKNVLFINHQNYLNICQYLISRIKQEYLSSKWVEQLIKITSSQVSKKKLYIYELDQNLQSLNKILSTIILNLNSTHQIINPKIELIYKNFIQYEAETINKIFMTDIIQIDNKGGSLLFSEKKYNNPIINNFFLSKNPLKPISLVLDLDETLMSFVYTDNEKKEGLSRLRPFLYNFLNLVKEYYEIITFTAATQSYADPILDAIEIKRGKYFNFRLYRNHCSIVNNIIVKDISLIGRDISKIIIVDNMQQNFKLQKENGILISSFWGEDSNDKALLQLGRILVTIATEMIGNNYYYDIRDLISKYKDDILKNVSMN
jgi:CTD small phosphatase-like protein 2